MHVYLVTAQDALEHIKAAYEKGKYSEVETIFHSVIDSVENNALKADYYYYLAKSQKDSWKNDEAFKNFLLSRDLYNKTNAKVTKIFSVNRNLAIIAREKGNYSKAKEFLNITSLLLDKMTESQKYKHAAVYQNSLGVLYLQNQELEKAINSFKKSIDLRRNYRNDHHIYVPLLNLALSYTNLKMYDSSIYYNRLAIDNLNQYPFKDYRLHYGIIYNNIGDNMQKLNNEGSKEYFLKALNTYKNNFNSKYLSLISTIYLNLGNHYQSKAKYDSALAYYNLSIETLIPENKSYNSGILNSISPLDMLDALQKKSLTQLHMGMEQNNPERYDQALETIETAIQIIEKTRNSYLNRESQLTFTANQKEIFNLAVYLASTAYQASGKEKYLNKFYEFSEKAKANVLLLAIRNLEAKEFGGIPQDLIKEEKNLVREIAYLEEQVYEMENNPENEKEREKRQLQLYRVKQEYDSLITFFENNYKEYFELKYDYDHVSLSTVKEKLKPHQALVHYYTTDSLLFRYTITNNNTKLAAVATGDDYDQALTDYYNSLSDFDHTNHTLADYKQYVRSANLLNQKIVPELHDNITEIIAIPDEHLAQLPFDAFLAHMPDTQSVNYQNLPYLLHEYNFSYNYSATLLYNKQYRPEPANDKLLAFAPDYHNGTTMDSVNTRSMKYREDLYPIPGAIEEIQNIGEFIQSDLYINDRATETVFKAQAGDYKIVHLAMHTIIDNNNPMFSKLAFSDNDTINDGFLNTHEIYNLKLNSKLAILSSCNSGSGQLQKAEGIMSLARGFIYAGCPSVIMTLWRIEDLSSAKLMTDFYQEMEKGHTITEALRLAKIAYLQESDKAKSHPYYWSSYVNIGENQRIFNPSPKTYIFLGLLSLVLIVVIRKLKRSRKALK